MQRKLWNTPPICEPTEEFCAAAPRFNYRLNDVHRSQTVLHNSDSVDVHVSVRHVLFNPLIDGERAGTCRWLELQAPEVTAHKLACRRVSERGHRPPGRSQEVKFLQTRTYHVAAAVRDCSSERIRNNNNFLSSLHPRR